MTEIPVVQSSSKAWYRHPMVWLVLGIPLSSVIVGILIIYLATNNPNDVVKDNYYKDGLGINKQFAEDEQARKLGLSAVFSAMPQLNKLEVKLSTTNQPFIQFGLFHATDRDLDITGAMAKTGAGVYTFQLDKLPEGRWYIELKGDDGAGKQVWRLRGRINFPLQSPLLLTPSEQ